MQPSGGPTGPRRLTALAATAVAACAVAACVGAPSGTAAARATTGAGSSAARATTGAGSTAASSAATASTRGTSATLGSPATESAATASTTDAAPPAEPAAPAVDLAALTLARMSLSQRVGQLLMVGSRATSADPRTLNAVTRYHVGNVMLTGRSTAGVRATARVSAALQRRATVKATAGVRLHVATDQEGGSVQVLRGSGFVRMPAALTQGRWTTKTLRSRATQWGRQLHAAGVTVNLAPVADTVPSAAFAPKNAPIGHFRREFGYTVGRVGSHAVAFSQGMHTARVQVAVKHFPGLGRVTANTDTTAGVTDRTTTRRSSDLQPFAASIKAGAPFVMMSTAYYSKMDARQPAAFSGTIVAGILRGDLGFRGVVISDDLGSARQVRRWSPGTRATRFVAAGGDMVLTVDPAVARSMFVALRDRARSDAGFRRQVDAAALRVLRSKQAQGLLPPR
ncbi:MAG TPA: glycoside hydrolase family 3 N-terminal domain-containing protein [Actinomycetales bacterium]|nr:glycoside hydrolase family 3 N-terminal domain-containing protein [Actinomycetales bacterium]